MIPGEVTALLTELLAGQQAVLGANLLGLYLRGSLVTGDFDPLTSDVDALCVTETALSAAELEALAAMHLRLAASSNRYARELELAYWPRAAARRWTPDERWSTLYRGSGVLEAQPHGENWVLERWAMLNGESTVHGPPPETLFEPVSAGQVRRAVLGRLRDWHAFATTLDDPGWSHRGHAAYAVETICRMLNTLQTGQLGSKPAAVRWALLNLPEPWRELVARSAAWKNDAGVDPETNTEVQGFTVWASQLGEVGVNRSSP
ncbi:hypothetical protein GCM10022631_12840 [Deinococcus rubellus]|uniref:DUF4111 domain-containing protein n=1 Tax=Deinococcus rubellus TaxID=1889240 RepID=A0ABY5YE18_9DEIO|nr:DUF4111 domain-containing protein [Deinococcus rubellus]UWX63289.1 DUF4111 domain-containing protein [Deinococcus rubellus]